VASLEGSHLIRLGSPIPEIGGRLHWSRRCSGPLTREVLHADLYEVDVERKLRLRVPLHFVGKAAASNGRIMQPIHRDVEVLCLPTDIPGYIEVDVAGLDIHDAVHVSQLAPPPGVEFVYDTDDTLVTVLPPTVEEVKVAAPEAVEGAPAERRPRRRAPRAPKVGRGRSWPPPASWLVWAIRVPSMPVRATMWGSWRWSGSPIDGGLCLDESGTVCGSGPAVSLTSRYSWLSHTCT